MTYQSFPIADYKSGVFTAKEPWLAPNDAFEVMINASVKRGRIRKRKGSTLVGYTPCRINVTLTWADDGGDNVEVTTSGAHGLSDGDYIIIPRS